MPFGFLYDRKDGAERCPRYKYTYWSYNGVKGLLLAFTHEKIFGLAGKRGGQWELFAKRSGNATDPAKDAPVWSTEVPAGTLAMLPAGNIVFVAGLASPADASGGMLSCHSTDDGKKLSELRFADAPVFDGMAAAGGRIYVSTQAGKVFCFGKQ